MPHVEFRDMEELRQRIGREVAVSDWLTVTQERVDQFADATDDHQWIHVDQERAAASPLGGTIAHGFLTLSLVSYFLGQALTLPPARMTLNYGLNRVRFTAPVHTGTRVRARIKLLDVKEAKGSAVDVYWQVTIELEGSERPACVAEPISRRYAD